MVFLSFIKEEKRRKADAFWCQEPRDFTNIVLHIFRRHMSKDGFQENAVEVTVIKRKYQVLCTGFSSRIVKFVPNVKMHKMEI